MTEFVKREMAALDVFQEEVSKYGLEVVRNAIGGQYEGRGTEVFILHMHTKPHPVKGFKALIAQLEQDGYHVSKRIHTDFKTGVKSMVFSVSGTARIKSTIR